MHLMTCTTRGSTYILACPICGREVWIIAGRPVIVEPGQREAQHAGGMGVRVSGMIQKGM